MEKVHNPFDLPIEKRNEWIPEDLLVQEKADLAFFVGCELAYRAKPMAVGAVRLLQSSETPYTLLDDEWCCGFPLYILGERGMEFIGEVKNNVKKLREKGVKEVTTYCPCCLNVMKRGWPEVIEVPFKISHIFQILSEKIKAGRLKFTKSFDGKVTYHDPCYLSRGWKEGENIIEEPRRIINSIPGADLVEMEHNKKLSLCPGSGGGLRRINLPLSHKMSVPVLKEADATGAEVLLTACPAVYERLKMTVEEGIYAPKVEIMDLLQFASNHL
jgi:heterodisulfide reductase subunit D